MPIEWRDEFASGEENVDKHHMRLFNFVNNIEEKINEHSIYPMGREDIASQLLFLERYVKFHFEYEEDCMFKHQCPAAQQNKEAHDKLIQYFTEFMQEFNEEGPTLELMTRLHTTMSNWLTNHILKIDTSLRHCI